MSNARWLLALFAVAGLAAQDAAPRLDAIVRTPMAVVPYDTIVLHGAGPVVGAIEELRPGDMIRYTPQGQDITISVDWSRVERVERRRDAAQVVSDRGLELLQARSHAALRVGATSELVRLARWGREQGAVEAVRRILAQVWEDAADNEQLRDEFVAALVASSAPEAADTLDAVLAQSLERWPTWSEGYAARARLYQRTRSEADYAEALDLWLQRQPTHVEANRMRAELAERREEWAVAAECWRRLATFHDQGDAGLARLRLRLWLGDQVAARSALEDLPEATQTGPAMAIPRAVLLLLDGQDAAASELLEAHAAAVVHPQLVVLRDYHRGLIAFSRGDLTLAGQLWSTVDHPWARFALARMQRQSLDTASADPVLQTKARTMTAVLALEREDHQAAGAALASGPSVRTEVLEAIAAAQAALYHPEALAPLARMDDRDARLWRAFGLLRLDQPSAAEAALTPLPADDGMAALYRMYAAAAAGDHARAVVQFRIAAADSQVPRAHLERLSSFFFDVQGDRLLQEDFRWPAGERLPVGWFSQAQGSGIVIRADGEHLVFTGDQRAGGNSISRVWRELPRERLRAVSLRCQQQGAGHGGLELRDADGRYGLAVAYAADRLAWRRCENGRWLPWEYHQGLLPDQLQIWIDPSMNGVDQVRLLTADTSIGLTSLLDLPGPVLAVGAFVAVDPGEQVQFVVDALEIRLREADEVPNSLP